MLELWSQLSLVCGKFIRKIMWFGMEIHGNQAHRLPMGRVSKRIDVPKQVA
jgi:hypothetical protein